MPTYVTVSQGDPGDEVVPILASSDPHVVAAVLDAMTRAMALELAAYGVRVNAVAPGATCTERHLPPDHPGMEAVAQRIPLKRFGMPLEIGAAVAFLASPDAAYITGQILYVDGGITSQLSPPGALL